MGKHHSDVCPGCSRHCPLSHVRCKYGQRYIEKKQKREEHKTTCKWEKHVVQGGIAWSFLWTARSMKRALRKKKITEEQLLASLSGEERAQLCVLLGKLAKASE